MNQKISELMDDELQHHELSAVLQSLKQDEQSEATWELYHLISDVIQQPALAESIHNHNSIKERLKQEPALLSSAPVKNKRLSNMLVSMAATLSAVAVVAWVSLQVNSHDEINSNPASVAQTATAQPDINSSPVDTNSSDYIMAHQEFSHGPDMSGGTYYARTVSYINTP